MAYYDWFIDRAYIMYGAQAGTAEFLETFREFPPSQRAGQLHHRPGDGGLEAAERRLTTRAPAGELRPAH